MNKNTKAYKNKKTYNKKYVIEKCKQVTLMLNKITDSDILEFLSGIDNKNAYIKELIRNDMNK